LVLFFICPFQKMKEGVSLPSFDCPNRWRGGGGPLAIGGGFWG